MIEQRVPLQLYNNTLSLFSLNNNFASSAYPCVPICTLFDKSTPFMKARAGGRVARSSAVM